MTIYIGTSGYGYKEWKGIFYPPKIAPGEMLHFYSKHFGTVEINNTFYRMPAEGVLTAWAERVPDTFIFAFKAPQVITHLKRLRNVDSEIGYFLRTLSVLGRRLGPVLFQFPKSFRADLPTLKAFLALLPRTISFAFEFRSPFGLDADILDLLREKGCSLCIADSEESPLKEIVSTAPWGYLRLRRIDYTDAELAQWRKRTLSQEWQRTFVFFKHDEEGGKGPEMAIRFQELINRQS